MEEKIFIPPLKIQGIKTKLVSVIKENIILDEDTIWIEPFMGSGVVGFNIAPENAIFADVNPHIINFYNEIKENKITSNIVRDFLNQEGTKLKEKGADYYYEVRERFNSNHNSLDFLFLNRSCFNGMMRFNKNYNFNVPFGHKIERFSKAYITKITNQINFIETKLKFSNWKFLCQSFERTISEANDKSFIYCDPPYIGRNVDYYDSWNEELELKLCNELIKKNVKFMLSTWDNNKYRKNEYINKIWSFCNKITKEHFYFIGAKEENRNSVIEALLTNYKIDKITNTTSIQIEIIDSQLKLF